MASPLNFAGTITDSLNQLQQIPGADTWPVSERLTAFFFMTLDGLDALQAEYKPGTDAPTFAQLFSHEAAGFLSLFHETLRGALSNVIPAPDVSRLNQLVTQTAPARFFVAELLVQLFVASLRDESEERQRSAALVDKTIAYAASVLATPVPEKAADVVRYAVEAGYLPLDRLPFIADWLGKSEGLGKTGEANPEDGEK